MELLLNSKRKNIQSIGKLGELSKSDIERIYSKISIPLNGLNKNDFWIWNGTCQDNKKGHSHGCIWYNGKYVLAHRIMYHNYIEDVPEFQSHNKIVHNKIVLHKCSHRNNGNVLILGI